VFRRPLTASRMPTGKATPLAARNGERWSVNDLGRRPMPEARRANPLMAQVDATGTSWRAAEAGAETARRRADARVKGACRGRHDEVRRHDSRELVPARYRAPAHSRTMSPWGELPRWRRLPIDVRVLNRAVRGVSPSGTRCADSGRRRPPPLRKVFLELLDRGVPLAAAPVWPRPHREDPACSTCPPIGYAPRA
jgi:hypothetical protein